VSEDEIDSFRREMQLFQSVWTITASSLNGVGRSIARYMQVVASWISLAGAVNRHSPQVMALLPQIADEALEGLHQLFNYYVFNVFTFFVPPTAIRSLCKPPPSPSGP
jgi:hypothetical protein